MRTSRTDAGRAADPAHWCRRAVVVVQGFTQVPPNGMSVTAHALRLQAENAGQLADSAIFLVPWNERMRPLAARIDDMLDAGGVVELYAYSWGAGSGGRELAAALGKRGLRIRRGVLVDPVYRAVLPIFRWVAVSKMLAKICEIRYAPIWDELPTVFVQANDVPTPSPVRVGRHGSRLPVHELTERGYGHQDMDGAAEVRAAILKCGERTIEEMRI